MRNVYKFFVGKLEGKRPLERPRHTRGINYCGTVKQNYKGMPEGCDNKILKLKWG
jgi:hypothetical protein